MAIPSRALPTILILVATVTLSSSASSSASTSAVGAVSPARPAMSSPAPAEATWLWPVDGPRTVTAPFRAPAHAYGAGHRGIDLGARASSDVRAPAGGVVAFRGVVVDRPLLTIAHDDGHVSTFEPVESTLAPGERVVAGDVIGVVGAGGHTPPGSVHVGVRLDGVYLNPLLLFGGVDRAVLLPCCDAL